jgi:hypothetical protein
MKVTIASVGGRTPPVRKRRRLPQDLVRALQFNVLALELFQSLARVCRQTGSLAVIAPVTQPSPQRRLDTAAQLSATDRIAVHCDVWSGACSWTRGAVTIAAATRLVL